VAHQAGAYLGFRRIKQLGILLLPLEGMIVHRRFTPSIKFASTHLYTWVERGAVRVKCRAQEHNTMSPARTETWTARSGVELTNHEATALPTQSFLKETNKNFFKFLICQLNTTSMQTLPTEAKYCKITL